MKLCLAQVRGYVPHLPAALGMVGKLRGADCAPAGEMEAPFTDGCGHT